MHHSSNDLLRFGPHRLDLKRQQLWTGDATVSLQPKTWALLLVLVSRPGELVSADELLNLLWPQGEVTAKALTNRVVELRKALGDDPRAPRLIQTVHRRGYRLLAPVTRGDGPAAPARPPVHPSTHPPAHPSAAAPATWAGPPGDAAAEGTLPDSLAAAASELLPLAVPFADPARLAGRDAEQAALAQHWALAGQGRRQMVLLAGEGGMGKTALADAFAQAVLAQGAAARMSHPAAGALLGRGPCLQQSAEPEALAPLLALVADLASGAAQAQVLPLLRRCAPSWLLQLPWLAAAAGATDGSEAAAWQRDLAGVGTGRMLREGSAFFELLSQHRPVLLVLEDLQWADPATIDLLDHLAQGHRPARLMVLGTVHPAPALQAQNDWLARSRRLLALGQLTEWVLGPLTLPEVQGHLAARFGNAALAPWLAFWVMRAAGGHPLLLAAVIDQLFATGRLRQGAEDWASAGDAELLEQIDFPERLRQLIAASAAQLEPGQQALLEAASVVGMQVSGQALAAALGQDIDEVEQACHALAQRQQWLKAGDAAVWPDGTLAGAWTFLHDIHRRALYDAIPPARRQLLHWRVAQRLAQGWGARPGGHGPALKAADRPEGAPEATARMLELAARACARRGAYAEAADAIQAALAQVTLLPRSTRRDRHELCLQLRHGGLLMVHRGLNLPRVLHALRDAEGLSLRLAEPRGLMRARLGICLHHILCAWAPAALRASEGLVALAQARQPSQLTAAHVCTGLAQLLAGHPAIALEHFERALSLAPEPATQRLLNLHVLARVQRVRCLVALGRPHEARQAHEQALAQARRLCVPADLVHNLFWAADSLSQLGCTDEAAALLDETVVLADAQSQSQIRLAAEVCRLGLAPPARRDLARMDALVQQLLSSGERWCDAKLLALIAETRHEQGDPTGARRALAQAEALLPGTPVDAPVVAQVRETLLMAA